VRLFAGDPDPMMIRSALYCALLLTFAAPTWAADTQSSKKPSAKPAAKAPQKVTAKAASSKTKVKPTGQKRGETPKKPASNPVVDKAAAKAATQSATLKGLPPLRVHPGLIKSSLKPQASPVLRGPREVLTCRDGTEDRHARIAVVLVGGKTESFAYYSKWKPRTCSIHLERNRDSSRWSDAGSVTKVNAERGAFMIEHGKGEYRIVFSDVDRERYCGMDGTINGTLTIRRGSERCEVAGIMEEGVPLGQAVAYMEASAAAASAPTPPTTVAAAPAQPTERPAETSFFKRLAQRLHHDPSPTWRGGVIVGD
jgi:hypothetical protein